MIEVWKDIQGYEGYYQVSNLGRVRSLPRIAIAKNGKLYNVRGGVMKTDSIKSYPKVCLKVNGSREYFDVHILVAKHFIDNPLQLREVNHKDGIKNNNIYSNLEWVSSKQNRQHAANIGLAQTGEKHYRSVLTNEEVLKARHLYQQGEEYRDLAKKFKVKNATMFAILKNKSYKHI